MDNAFFRNRINSKSRAATVKINSVITGGKRREVAMIPSSTNSGQKKIEDTVRSESMLAARKVPGVIVEVKNKLSS